MKQKKKNDIAALLDYAGSHRGLTFLGLGLSAASSLRRGCWPGCSASSWPQGGLSRGFCGWA